MGGSLIVFGKDHNTAEEGQSQVHQKQGSCSQACGFATITMYSWWRFGEPCTVAKSTFFSRGGGWKLVTLLAVAVSTRYYGTGNLPQIAVT